MDIVIALILSAVALIFVVSKGMFIGYMLILSYSFFAVVCIKRRYSIKEILTISWNSSKSSVVVLQIFILIGGIIGIWFASGTIPAIVYYSLGYLNPNIFVLLCFVICSITSFLIGTSFGTCSVMGVPLMIIAMAGGANKAIVAGAIISGAYFGDRNSLMSGSAALVASATGSNITTNVKNMLKTGLLPTGLSMIFFWYISRFSIIGEINPQLREMIGAEFGVSILLLVPCVVVLIMALMGFNIKKAMVLSICIASIFTVVIQKNTISEMIRYIFVGFQFSDLEHPLGQIIKGGGIVSMLKPAMVVLVSTSLTGLLTQLRVTDGIRKIVDRKKYSRHSIFAATSIVSTVASMVGCNQSISIIMTENIMRNSYIKFGIENGLDMEIKEDENKINQQIAIDLENSSVVLAGFVPWSIAAIVPASTIGVTPFEYMPFAFFLLAVPVCHFFQLIISQQAS